MSRFEPFNDDELELMYSALVWQYKNSTRAGMDKIKALIQGIYTEQLERSKVEEKLF